MKNKFFFYLSVLIFFFAQTFFCSAEQKPLRVHFLSVGYADAALIEFPDGKNILLDSGSSQTSSELLQYLKTHQISALTAAIITHPHKNHFGGLLDILQTMPVRHVYFNGDYQNKEEGFDAVIADITRQKIPLTILRRDDIIPTDEKNVVVKILHPEKLSGSANENSLVVFLKYRKTSFLFTSDISPAQQDEIFEKFPDSASANCIQIPHHGGELSPNFINETNTSPKIFVISTGLNSYGKPFLADIKKIAGKILRTDQDGPVIIESDGKTMRRIRHE